MSDGKYGKRYLHAECDSLHVLEKLIILLVDTSYWFYAPNKGAAIFFCVGFCSSGCLHIYQCMYVAATSPQHLKLQQVWKGFRVANLIQQTLQVLEIDTAVPLLCYSFYRRFRAPSIWSFPLQQPQHIHSEYLYQLCCSVSPLVCLVFGHGTAN